jgi:hypothetical protein
MIEQASLVLGNGNWAVKSDSLLGYKTIDGKYYPRDMTFTRATTGTRVNEAGLVEVVPYNLLTYSEEFDNAAWDKLNGSITANTAISPSGVQDADNFIPSATSGAHALRSNFVNTTTTTSHSFFVKANGYTKVSVRESQIGGNYASFDLSNGTLLDTNQSGYIENYGNGWYRCTLIDTLFGTGARSGLFVLPPSYTSGSPTITWLPNGTSGVFVWGAQLVEGSTAKDYLPTTDRLDIARIDYSTGEPALLLEPQRTNLALESNQFNESEWNKTNTSVSANETGVGGSTNAWLLSKSSSGALIRQFIATTGENTFSVYVKKGTLSWVRLYIASSTESSSVYVNLNNGSTGTSSGTPTVNVIPMDNGWYRCIITKNTTNINNFRIYPADADNDTSGTSGNIYIQYAQIEQGSYATSYIPTTSAIVTRNQDVCVKTGASALIGQTEGVAFLEFDNQLLTSYPNEYIFQIRNTAGTTQLWMRKESGSPYFTARLIVSSSTIWTFTGIPVPNGNTKIAISYKTGDSAIYLNGTQFGSTNTAAFSGSSFTDFYFNLSGTANPELKLQSAMLFKTRLTNAELATLTTI